MNGISDSAFVASSMFIIFASVALFYLFPFVVFFHCWVSKDRGSRPRRWLWTLVIALFWPLGSLVYGFFGSRSRMIQVLTGILAVGSVGVAFLPNKMEIRQEEHSDLRERYAKVGETRLLRLDSAWGELARPGWGNYLKSVAWSADGNEVLVGRTRTLELRDAESGRLIRTLESLPENANVAGWLTGKWLGRGGPVALSPDGRYALADEGDVSIKTWLGLWDFARQVVQGDRRVQRWDLETGKSGFLTGHDSNVKAIAFVPGGSQAATVSFDRTVKLWDVPRGRSLATLEGHASWIYSLAVSHDGRRALSGGDLQYGVDPAANTLWLWDLEAKRGLRGLNGHTDRVLAIAFSPDDSTAVSASYDRTIRVWDLESGSELRRVWVAGIAGNVAFSSDARYAAVGTDEIKIWDVELGAIVDRITVSRVGDEAKVLAFSPDARGLVVGTKKGALLFYRSKTDPGEA